MKIKIEHEWTHGYLAGGSYCDECGVKVEHGHACYTDTTAHPMPLLCERCYGQAEKPFRKPVTGAERESFVKINNQLKSKRAA